MATFMGRGPGGSASRRAAPLYVRGPRTQLAAEPRKRTHGGAPSFPAALPVALSLMVGSALVLLAMVAWSPGNAPEPDTGALISLEGASGAAIAPVR